MAIRNCADIGENLIKMVNRLMENDDLIKLLYYTDKDPLSTTHPSLTAAEKKEKIFKKLIRVIPRVGATETANSIITLRVANAAVLQDNKEFKRVYILVEVFTPLTQWEIKDTNLRPFKIMGEIEKSLAGKRINGIGVMNYSGFELQFLTDEIACYAMEFELTSYD